VTWASHFTSIAKAKDPVTQGVNVQLAVDSPSAENFHSARIVWLEVNRCTEESSKLSFEILILYVTLTFAKEDYERLELKQK
jgi:hypothetical protein